LNEHSPEICYLFREATSTNICLGTIILNRAGSKASLNLGLFSIYQKAKNKTQQQKILQLNILEMQGWGITVKSPSKFFPLDIKAGD
jgi:hypothetical protein